GLGAGTGVEFMSPDGQLIGPFNAFLYNPAIGSALLGIDSAVSLDSSLSAPIREIVTLAAAGLWGSDYVSYAHEIRADLLGLAPETIESLANGGAPVGLTGDDLIAAQFTQELVQTHRVDDALYHAAEAAFGQEGVVDMVNLVGAYLA